MAHTTNTWNGRWRLLRASAEAASFDAMEFDGSPSEKWQCVRARLRDVPLEVRVREGGLTRGTWTVVRVACPGAPVELTLRPELTGEGIDKLLGMTVDEELGDPAFDRRFVVETAPREVAPKLLGRGVRKHLMALAITDESPLLTLREGELLLQWKGEPEPAMVAPAVEAALGIREAAGELQEGIFAAQGHTPFRQDAGDGLRVDPRARSAARSRISRSRRRIVTVVGALAVTSAGIIAGLLGSLPHL
ncbi:MAG: hypothetical protein HY909_12730 [Deltaproteobacteria bacterium]|nr:hypothetical protein [Deltaproteobacteria bacterium]